MQTTDTSLPRAVSCPRCRAPARYSPDNPWRPFCSERCRRHDLGAWASEAYRVATDPGASDDASENA